jgi:hypothetical protein
LQAKAEFAAFQPHCDVNTYFDGRPIIMRKIIVVAFGLAAAGCQTTSAPLPTPAATASIDDATAFAKAKEAVVASLKDPDSAKFGPAITRKTIISSSFLDMGQHRDIVCGTVNAKNSYGGYTGQSQYAYMVKDGTVVIDNAKEPYASMWCNSILGNRQL